MKARLRERDSKKRERERDKRNEKEKERRTDHRKGEIKREGVCETQRDSV